MPFGHKPANKAPKNKCKKRKDLDEINTTAQKDITRRKWLKAEYIKSLSIVGLLTKKGEVIRERRASHLKVVLAYVVFALVFGRRLRRPGVPSGVGGSSFLLLRDPLKVLAKAGLRAIPATVLPETLSEGLQVRPGAQRVRRPFPRHMVGEILDMLATVRV
uniref:Uncharacterized protein n=1 Tax=Oryza meridionalis TaxID=40149 RepID=A0A0E0EV69_9ORYZ